MGGLAPRQVDRPRFEGSSTIAASSSAQSAWTKWPLEAQPVPVSVLARACPRAAGGSGRASGSRKSAPSTSLCVTN